MAINEINAKHIPLKAYLRADSYSQHFEFCNEDGETEELVTDEMFWGTLSNDKLYLDYSLINGRKIDVTEGIYQRNGAQTMRNEYCDDWISKNIIKLNESKMFVIQGYAGCGKTTFMNSIIRKWDTSKSYYIDIGRDWTYQQEPYMFFNESLAAFDNYMDELIMKRNIRQKVWNKFIELGSDLDIKKFDLELPNIIPEFIAIKRNSNWNTIRGNLHGYLNNTYNCRNNNKRKKSNTIWHNYGHTDTIISVLILMICARSRVEEKTKLKVQPYNLIFDNLDVITDPAIPAENVVTLWRVIQRFTDYKNLYKKKSPINLPNIGIFITVRKVLYSHITAHLPDLEMLANCSPYLINVCDISELYISQEILKHRISYWTRHINDEEVISKLAHLEEIAKINDNTILPEMDGFENSHGEYILKSTINLEAFFNHNYRAFSNVFSIFLEDNELTNILLADFSKKSSSKDWQKVATLIFEISLLYRKEKVWNKMGFGCTDFEMIDYPTTLNRLILNYLYVSKCGQVLRKYVNVRQDIPAKDYVFLKELVRQFSKAQFITVESTLNEEQIQEKFDSVTNFQTKNMVVERLADMCARNPGSRYTRAYGYNSEDDELWRRPLYFVGGVKLNHTAASDEDLKLYFEKCLTEKNADQPQFSITDEGFILIHDIVASFEFYSARYCKDTLEKPLHQAVSKAEINILIQSVYNAIDLCCKRHNFFMKQYMEKYKLSINDYLKQNFHPRTKPRFDEYRKMTVSSFRPQLHIVRVIYLHIAYFNAVKELISISCLPEKNELCECLSGWIKKYLNLYEKNFYSFLDSTICKSDNNVFHYLKNLLNEQMKHYGVNGDYKNVNIGKSISYR